MDRAGRGGHRKRVAEDTAVGAPRAPQPAPDVPAEYQNLSTADFIERIDDESDPKKLEALLQTEKRKPVVAAVKKRLEEVAGGGAK